MKKTVLREYARLIVRSGLNVQKGQDVLVYADLDQPEFVRLVVEECYKAKARAVTVFWNDQAMDKLHNRYQSIKTMGQVPEWVKARQEYWCETLPCRLHLISEDPDGLKGMNMAKAAKARQLSYPILKPYIDQRRQAAVVHRSSPRKGMGKEGVPWGAGQCGNGKTVGGNFVHLPGQ